jgi:hypothetical protein
VSLVVTCQTAGLVAERTMTWQLGADEREGHSSPGVRAGSTDWYFAEGDTGFATYFALLNLSNTTSHVQVDYLHSDGNLYSATVDIGPYARATVAPPAWLPLGSFGVHIHATTQLAAERSVYGGPNWTLGTNGVGANIPLINTYLSEGATGSFWDTYILIANPSSTTTANVWLAFLQENGQLNWQFVAVGPHSRQSVMVDTVPGMASANFRTEVRSDIPVVAERVTYWPGSAGAGALSASLSGVQPTGTAGSVSPEPSLGFNPYTARRPRAPARLLGRYQVVTEGDPAGDRERALAATTPDDGVVSPKGGGTKTTTTSTSSSGATTNDAGSSTWYGAHLTGGKP